MAESEDAIVTFLSTSPTEICAISQRLRQLVAQVAPQTIEILQARHNHIAYSITGNLRERIFYICPLNGWVRLGFDYGGALADPERLLEGEGKRMRHVKVRTLAQASDPALVELAAAGWAAGAAALAAR